MATYTDITTRLNAQSLIPEDLQREIIQGAVQESVVMRMGRRMPDLPRAQRRVSVNSVLPFGYFVTGDTGLKQTTKLEYEDIFFDAEEIAVILPISEAVLEDLSVDFFAEARPKISEAFGIVLDRAVFFGTNAPASWRDDILTSATAAGHDVTIGTGVDLYQDLLGVGGVEDLVAKDGYPVTGHVADISMKARLSDVRDANGNPIFALTMQDMPRWFLHGSPVDFPLNGSMDPLQALDFAGDWRTLVWAQRTEIRTKLLDQASLHDGAGDLVINFAQQDAVGLRMTWRVAWQIFNPINRMNEVAATRFPFAVLLPA
jgi:HK97 family phage major capsid protein